MEGVVTAFDERRGLGTIGAGRLEYPFHCTALRDGTRTVTVGTEVTFEVRPGPRGRWEAAEILSR